MLMNYLLHTSYTALNILVRITDSSRRPIECFEREKKLLDEAAVQT